MDNDPIRPSPKLVFDKTIQVGTLLSMFTLAVAGIGGGFAIYQGVQTQLYDQKTATTDAVRKIDVLTYDLNLVKASVAQLRTDLKENVSELKAEQKETINGIQKTLNSVADDLLKVRISLASRGGRSGLLCDPGSNCWSGARLESSATFEAITTPSDYPAHNRERNEPLRIGTFE